MFHFIKIITITLLSVSLFACDNTRKQQFVKKAQQSLEKGELQKAQHSLEQALVIDPDDINHAYPDIAHSAKL